MRSKAAFTWMVGACLLFAGAGCGKKAARLDGVVTWNGIRVDGGAISFQPAGKPERQIGTIIENDGSFRIDIPADITDGEFKVLIQAARKTTRKVRGQNIDQPEKVSYEFEQ